MSDFVRVNHPIFGHFSTRKPDVWGGEVTGDTAVDANGKPLPAKPRLNVKPVKSTPAKSEARPEAKVD